MYFFVHKLFCEIDFIMFFHFAIKYAELETLNISNRYAKLSFR